AGSLVSAQLLATTPNYVEHTYYEVVGTLSAASPVQTYRVRSADIGPGLTNVMSVVVESVGESDDPFRVNVLDDQGNPVAAQVVTDRSGNYAVQIPGVVSDRDYYVQVVRADAAAVARSAFDVVVDFAQDGAHLQTFVNETLDSNTREYAVDLQ